MKDLGSARALAASMVAIGRQAGVRTEAVITDMDAPLGHAIGNALEIIECLDTLKGKGPADLTSVVCVLRRGWWCWPASPGTIAMRPQPRVTGARVGARARDICAADRTSRRQSACDRGRGVAAVGTRSCGVPGTGRRLSDVGEGATPSVMPATCWAPDVPRSARRSITAWAPSCGAKPGDRVARGQPMVELHHRGARPGRGARAVSRCDCRSATSRRRGARYWARFARRHLP